MSPNIPLDVYFKKRHGISEYLFESLNVLGLTRDEKGKVIQEAAFEALPEYGPRKTALEGIAMRAKEGEDLPVFLLQRKE